MTLSSNPTFMATFKIGTRTEIKDKSNSPENLARMTYFGYFSSYMNHLELKRQKRNVSTFLRFRWKPVIKICTQFWAKTALPWDGMYLDS